MTIAGVIPDPTGVQVQFVRAGDAQEYIARLEGELVRLDGGPLYLVDDGETGTSDIVVSDFVNALVSGKGTGGLALTDILNACFAQGTNFRIWLASNDLMSHTNAVEVGELAGVQAGLEAWRGVWWHAPTNRSVNADAKGGPAASPPPSPGAG